MRSKIRGRGKRGGIASFISFFGATIFIIFILGIYFFGGSVVKKIDRKASDAALAVQDESMVGIDNIFSYTSEYSNLTRVRSLVASGDEVEMAILEVGYEE